MEFIAAMLQFSPIWLSSEFERFCRLSWPFSAGKLKLTLGTSETTGRVKKVPYRVRVSRGNRKRIKGQKRCPALLWTFFEAFGVKCMF